MYYLEKGKSLYGLKRYEEALETLKHATIPDYMSHPLDQSWLLTAGSYRALCHIELQDKPAALQEAKEAVQTIDGYPDSIFTSFIKETLQIIQNFKNVSKWYIIPLFSKDNNDGRNINEYSTCKRAFCVSGASEC